MKADRSGTFTEQERERAGWITVRGFGPRCDHCAHSDAEQRETSTSWRCTKHGFATKANAYCMSYRSAPVKS